MTTTALVTGGASGIGEALARALAQDGTTVIVADRQAHRADEICNEITQAGGRARREELDVRDAEAFERSVADIFAREGRLDYFFNNAGVGIGGEADNMTLDDWNEIIDVNIRGVTNGIQAIYPRMVEQGYGHIINTASMAGLTPAPMAVGYSMTKHAVVGLSQSLRIEGALHGVKVSALCPGAIRTSILDGGGRYGHLNQMDDKTVLDLWERLRPMDIDRFAGKVLAQVKRNRGIIVVPGWWKTGWWLGRLSPHFAVKLGEAAYRRTLKALG